MDTLDNFDIDEVVNKINNGKASRKEKVAFMRHLNNVAEYTKTFLQKLQDIKQAK